MPTYDKIYLANRAKELSVVRDTFEKVLRLCDILRFFDSSEYFRQKLALKGGTAINLLFFDLPRLSVDIDLDFCENVSREEMIRIRETIDERLKKHMAAAGYTLSPKSKMYHSLYSYVYEYINSGGVKDNIKIEINYSLRSHILPTQHMILPSHIVTGDFEVNTLSPIEIYATKTVALLTRGAARDLYDMDYMIRREYLSEDTLDLYRRCVVFYLAVATETPMMTVDYTAVEQITPHRIMTDLKPVIRDRDTFELDDAKRRVEAFLDKNLYLTENDLYFLRSFRLGRYKPENLFSDERVLERIADHPMALWKTQRNRDKGER